MIRHVAAAVLVLSLTPSWLSAQSVAFTVNTASANVHKGPSTASPVIGTVRRGSTLPVTRELGSWVRVNWPSADDGIGYIHVSTGSVARNVLPPSPQTAAGNRPANRTSANAAPASSAQRQRPAAPQPAPARNVYVTPMTHTIGVGATMGSSPVGFGVSARAWHRSHFGAQVDYSHYSTAAPISPDRVSSTQFEPSVMFHFEDHVADSIWIRPYAGSGVSFGNETLTMAEGSKVSDSRFGVQAFGGAEVTFPALSRFSLSTGLSYRWTEAPFAGVDLGGLGFSVAAHWYIK
jgi:SH3 domain-containing protein